MGLNRKKYEKLIVHTYAVSPRSGKTIRIFFRRYCCILCVCGFFCVSRSYMNRLCLVRRDFSMGFEPNGCCVRRILSVKSHHSVNVPKCALVISNHLLLCAIPPRFWLGRCVLCAMPIVIY